MTKSKPTNGASISADAHRAAIEATPDTRPNPLEALIASEHQPDTSLLRFVALVRAFPTRYAHALCNVVMGGGGDAATIAAIARECGISRQAVSRHLERARRLHARMRGGC